jgi:predicted dehydrogenase
MNSSCHLRSLLYKALFPLFVIFLFAFQPALNSAQSQRSKSMTDVRFMTLDPGHFHAGLVQKEMYPNVSPRVDVYAPLGPDLLEHLNRIISFNTRKTDPTGWKMEIHTGPDFLDRMIRERPGNVVIISGRNRGKIDRIKASLEAGFHVLSDKPWIIDPADFPKLEAALNIADQKNLIAYDIMTERYEITSILQRELMGDPAVFGSMLPGSEQNPSVFMESVHYLLKLVAGLPNRRPAWFFDIQQQGEALPDVGTHLVDLVQWMMFPERSMDYRKDIRVLTGKRWPTVLSKAEFQRVTGENDFPDFLREHVKGDKLDYYCNTMVSYALRDIHAKLNVLWKYEPLPGAGDTHFAYFKGSRSRIEIRQEKEDSRRPELYVVPNNAAEKVAILAALRKKVDTLQTRFADISMRDLGQEMRIEIPDKYRVGHEAHFAQVTNKFLGLLKDPKALPPWEKPNMLSKYWVTTQGLLLSRK